MFYLTLVSQVSAQTPLPHQLQKVNHFDHSVHYSNCKKLLNKLLRPTPKRHVFPLAASN